MSTVTDPREFAVRRVTMSTALRMGVETSAIPAAMREAVQRLRAGASVYGSAHRAVVERLPRHAPGRDLPPAA